MPNQYQLITLDIAIPIILRNRKRAPERCARNLMELGEKLNKHNEAAQLGLIYNRFVALCKGEKEQPIIDYFLLIYFP